MSNFQSLAVVTGAADGIGWATAQLLAAQGWQLALLDTDGAGIEQRAKTLGGNHAGWVCDVTDAQTVGSVVREIQKSQGPIKALVNNAGIGDQTAPTLSQDPQAFDRVLSVHLRGTFLMSQQVIGCMTENSRDEKGCRGAIVNIGSIASVGGLPGRNAYSAAKAGILGMTRAMASEWARKGIRINAVAPGYVNTALVKKLVNQGSLNTAAISHRTPMGRLGEPEEIAQAISFLMSPQASYITGAVLAVDGGWTAFGAPEASLGPVENS
jgi:NAD(P)-dependent dehydrogenase (short-subunit alcohol dehydrogenase family)